MRHRLSCDSDLEAVRYAIRNNFVEYIQEIVKWRISPKTKFFKYGD